MREVLEDAFDVLTSYLDVLDMHLVFANGIGIDWFEGAGTNM